MTQTGLRRPGKFYFWAVFYLCAHHYEWSSRWENGPRIGLLWRRCYHPRRRGLRPGLTGGHPIVWQAHWYPTHALLFHVFNLVTVWVFSGLKRWLKTVLCRSVFCSHWNQFSILIHRGSVKPVSWPKPSLVSVPLKHVPCPRSRVPWQVNNSSYSPLLSCSRNPLLSTYASASFGLCCIMFYKMCNSLHATCSTLTTFQRTFTPFQTMSLSFGLGKRLWLHKLSTAFKTL